jgi:hypothetical protein
MDNENVNPRYVAYAKFHNRTPEKMLERDKKEFPGGCMCGFILWINEMLQEFYKASPSSFISRHVIGDQKAWTDFLVQKGNKGKL